MALSKETKLSLIKREQEEKLRELSDKREPLIIDKDFPISDIEIEEDRVMIDPDEKHERKSKGGIIMVKDQEEADSSKWGTVVLIGPDTKDNPMRYRVGDRVIFGKYAGGEFVHADKEYLIIRQGDIFGKQKRKA